jgi:outer membrane immunogenic protein
MLRNAVFASMLLPITAAVATATDLPPTHKSPPGPDLARPAFAWTGFYIGLNAGGAFSDNGGAKTTGAPGFLALGPTLTPGSLGDDSSGFLGGAQIGYIHQVGALVWGVEADLDYADLKKTGSFTSAATLLGSTLTTSATTRLDYLGTARARQPDGYSRSGRRRGNPRNRRRASLARASARAPGSRARPSSSPRHCRKRRRRR